MNAKKIMGAVLVALLAAALFVGAGAAAEEKSLGTVFVYQNTSYTGSWTGTAGTVEFVNGVIEALPAPGYYSNGSAKIYVSYPTAAISAVANTTETYYYNVIGGNLYVEEGLNVTVSVQAPAKVAVHDILITYPNGLKKSAFEALGLEEGYAIISTQNGNDKNFLNGTVVINLNKTQIDTLLGGQTGEFKLQALFAKINQKNVLGANIIPATSAEKNHQLVSYTPDQYLFAQDVYSFTVADKENDVTISASVDKVLKGKTFTVTITGVPGNTYTLVEKEGNVEILSAGGYTINATSGKFQMPSGGSITVYLQAVAGNEDDEITVAVNEDSDAKVTVEILKETLTATVGAASYIIGDVIEVTLTTDGELNSAGYYFTITGTNYGETPFAETLIKQNNDKVYELKTADLSKKLDVGTYTIKIYTATDKKSLVATVPVSLKQPLISIIDAPEVVVQGKDAKFIINAEATANITAYVFGTNFFMNLSTMGKGITVEDEKNAPNQFTVTIKAVNTTNMSTGQYFAVFQHPMYDGNFNIGAQGDDIVLNETADVYKDGGVTLFNVSKRQTANAAQALCDNLDSQNIDDMYVKASFFVVGKDESFTISEIPTTIAQGETLTISGVSTANADGTVTVEMISTAFAAVPKETVGSAAFIAVSTKVAEDGTWEITMDTSDLNVDEYSLKVAVTPADGKTETWKNVNINVVEGADEPVNPEQPEEPGQDEPEEPVAPATPGFGALAALAGLGAVAVLLLRRE